MTSPADSRRSASARRSGSSVGLALAERVRLYLKVAAAMNIIFSALVIVVTFFDLDVTRRRDQWLSVVVIVTLTVSNLLALAFVRRVRHIAWALLLLEAVITLSLSATYSWGTLLATGDPTAADQVSSVLMVTLVLTLRSSLVPCPMGATVAAGAFSFLFPVTISLHQLAHLPFIYHLWTVVLCCVVVGITSVASHTIYGLNEQMRSVTRLGQYQLRHPIGEGSMGEVYLATHAMLQRPTAVKLLRDVTSAAARERFRQEVRAASGLTHPNTVEIYDYGRSPDGVFYFAMEYVEGASLDDVVKTAGVMPAGRVVHLLSQAAGSLSEAHGRGLVHRDIKPSNLMICERGGSYDTLKVLDFGLVQDLADETDDTSQLTGTPLYLAPEAIVDAQGFVAESDVYALGATAYFLLTGEPPFLHDDVIDVLADHLATEPETPTCEDPGLSALVLRCLAKEPKNRPADAAALLHELRSCKTYGSWSDDDARTWWAEHEAVLHPESVGERSA
ncbi:MAG: serine/threonine-protein kinase [Myxococcota bacterium]